MDPRDYEIAVESGLSSKKIESYARKVAEVGGFEPGGDIRALLDRFGGSAQIVEYPSDLEAGSVFIDGPCSTVCSY